VFSVRTCAVQDVRVQCVVCVRVQCAVCRVQGEGCAVQRVVCTTRRRYVFCLAGRCTHLTIQGTIGHQLYHTTRPATPIPRTHAHAPAHAPAHAHTHTRAHAHAHAHAHALCVRNIFNIDTLAAAAWYSTVWHNRGRIRCIVNIDTVSVASQYYGMAVPSAPTCKAHRGRGA
jgi:hypothetical protein